MHFVPLFLILFFLLPAGSLGQVENLGAHFRDPNEFQRVIDARCTVCHTRDRVDIAIRERRDLARLTSEMTERGAVLDKRDKEVLGTFWGSPLEEKKDPVPSETVAREDLQEYRRIIETKCILCHTRGRIDDAIERQLPFQSVEEILLRRGVVLTERERKVLGTFWGNPLK